MEHPGKVLLERYLKPRNMSIYELASKVGIPRSRLTDVVNGKRRITADTAVKLAAFFDTDARYWLDLQSDYDLEAWYQKQRD